MTDLDYYDFTPIFTRNGTFNFIVGARGTGKTYGAKKYVIRKAIRKGEEFIYLRRYSTELKMRHTFFADIAHEFPNHQLRVNGTLAQYRAIDAAKDDPWLTMGYFVQLSNAQSKKSVAYPKVRTIIFDEFIIDKGIVRYLPDEAKAFNDFYQTVDRWQDRTRVLFLANALSIMNPYFMDYGIEPTQTDEWIVKDDGFIVAHFPQSEAFAASVYKTKFGKFIAGSDYADYSIRGIFKDNANELIEPKPSDATYMLTLETKYGTFSIWHILKDGAFYVSDTHPKNAQQWTMLPENMSTDKTLMFSNDKFMGILRHRFARGKVTFSSPTARNAITATITTR